MNSPADISSMSMLLRDSELVNPSAAFDTLLTDCTELIKLLTTSVKTTKGVAQD